MIALKEAERVDLPAPTAPKPRRAKAWARISIKFDDGKSATFSIHNGPFGLTVSPTLAGRKVATLLKQFR